MGDEQSDGREVLDRAFGLALSLLLALGHRKRSLSDAIPLGNVRFVLRDRERWRS